MAQASIKIGASVSEYQAAMKACVAGMKQLSEEYNLAAVNAKLYGTQSDVLRAKINELTAKMELQKGKILDCNINYENLSAKLTDSKKKHDELKQKIIELTKSYEASKEATGKDSEETRKLKEQLNAAENQVARSEKGIKSLETALSKQELATTKAKVELANMELQLRNTNAELAKQKFDEYAEKAEKVGQTTEKIGKQMTKITAVITGVGAAAVTVSANFEEEMSKVQAISGATAEETEKLTESARQWGRDTKYSATEAAEAFEYMALAGWKTSDMLDGIGGILNLAAASAMDLGTASDIVTDYLTAFGLTAQDATRFADEMAFAMSHSNTTTELLGEAYKNCAATAASLNYSVEETTAVLMTMANAGVKGGEAGTALNAIMTRLATNTKECGDKLAEYGVQIYDSEGNMNSLSSILTGMRSIWNDLTDEQQANLAKTIAGTNQFSALQTIMSGLSDEAIASGMSFNDYSEALQNCSGTSADMAATMQDNLKGQLTQLKSKFEDIGITIGQTLLPYLKELADKIASAANWFSSLSESQQKTIIAIAGVVAAAGPLIIASSKLITATSTVSKSLGSLAAKFVTSGAAASGASGAAALFQGALAAITSPVGIAVAAIVGLTAVITTLWNTNEGFRNTITDIWDRIKTAFVEAGQHITDKLNELGFSFSDFGDVVKSIWETICNILAPWIEGVFNNIAIVIETTLNVITNVFDIFAALFTGDWQGVWDGIKGVFVSIWNGIKDKITNILDTIKNTVDVFLNLFGTSWNEVWGAIKTTFEDIWNAISSTVTTVLTTIRDTFESIWTHIRDFVTTTFETIKNVITVAVMAIAEFFSAAFEIITLPFRFIWENCKDTIIAVWDAISEKIETVINAVKDAITTVWTAVSEFFSTIWNAIKDVVLEVWNAISDKILTAVTKIQSTISTVFTAVKSTVTNIFNGIKSTASTIWNAISSTISSVIDKIKNTVTTAFNAIKSTITSVFNTIKSIATSVWNSIKNAIITPINAAKTAVSNAIEAIKSKFNFSWSLPNLKLPHPKITGKFSLNPPSVPHFSMDWYKNGAIMNGPTIFGMNGNTLLAGGEPETGGEAILPLKPFYTELNSMLDKKLERIESATNVTVESHTYIDGEEVASKTYSKMDAKMVSDKRKER